MTDWDAATEGALRILESMGWKLENKAMLDRGYVD